MAKTSPTKSKNTIPPSEVRDGRVRPRTADGEPVHQMLLRLPETLHEKLRKRAYEDHRAKAEIVRDALALYLRD